MSKPLTAIFWASAMGVVVSFAMAIVTAIHAPKPAIEVTPGAGTIPLPATANP